MDSSNLGHFIRSLKEMFVNFVGSCNFEITNEIYTEISAIMSGLDSLKMQDMFQNSSTVWRKNTDSNQLINYMAGN